MRVRVHIVQPHPCADGLGQPAELVAKIEQPRLHRLAVPETGAVPNIDAVSAGVLADDQQLLHAGLEQPPRFAEHIADRPRHQVAAHRRDDAEAATVVAAFADLQVGIVPRRELDALRRHQIDEGIVRLRAVAVHRVDHLLRGMRSGHGQHLGVHLPHQVAAAVAGACAQAAGDDDAAVGIERLTDRVEAFLHRLVDEAAGVDDHQVGAVVGLAGGVTLGLQLRQDQLGIGQRLRAAERNEADGGPADERYRWKGTSEDYGYAAATTSAFESQCGISLAATHCVRCPIRNADHSGRSAPGPGMPWNSVPACLVICSCICANRLFDCSM